MSSQYDPVCWPGAFGGDLDGNLGAMWTLAKDSNQRVSRFQLDLLRPDGQVVSAGSRDTMTSFFTIQLEHGAGVIRLDPDAKGTLVRLDPGGAVADQPMGMVRSSAAVPGGGTVVAEGGTVYTMDGRTLTAPLQITRRDDSGATLWSTPIPSSIAPNPLSADVYPNTLGHVLAVVALDPFQARRVWLDEQGRIASTGDVDGTFNSLSAIGPWFELPDHSLAFGTSPAHGGGGWHVVHDLDPRLDLPPCWLDQRQETRVFPIRGGRGYAVFHGTTFSGNESRRGLEIVASSGESCGWIEASCGDPTPGACDLELARLGLDGTLYLNAVSQGSEQRCLVESWPALLK